MKPKNSLFFEKNFSIKTFQLKRSPQKLMTSLHKYRNLRLLSIFEVILKIEEF